MLTVKTTLKESPGKGIGLFADQNIKTGESVWKYHPLIDIKVNRKDIPKETKDFFDTYSVDRGGKYLFLNTDNARFMNHSKQPNVKSLGHLKDNVAIRNIKKGEELLIDYEEIDVNKVNF